MSFPTPVQCEAIQLVGFSKKAERTDSIKNGPSPVRREVGDYPSSGQDQLRGKVVDEVDWFLDRKMRRGRIYHGDTEGTKGRMKNE